MWRTRCVAAAQPARSSTATLRNGARKATSSRPLATNAASNTTPSSSSSPPILSYTLALLLLGGAGYTGAAYYALHDPAFRKTWIDNVPGGEAALVQVAKLEGTSIEDVKRNTAHLQELAVQNYEKSVQKLNEVKHKADTGLAVAKEKLHETQTVASEKLENLNQFVGSVRDGAIATYESAQIKVKEAEHSAKTVAYKVEQAYHDTVDTVEEAFEKAKSVVTGETVKPKPPRVRPESPRAEPAVVVTPPQIKLADKAPAAKPKVADKVPEPAPPTKTVEKRSEPVVPILANSESLPVESLSKSASTVVVKDSHPAESGVMFVTGEGPAVVPTPEAVSTPAKPTPVAPAAPKPPVTSETSDALKKAIKNVESVFADSPDRPVARNLAHAISSLAVTLGTFVTSTNTDTEGKLDNARRELIKLTTYLNELQDEESALVHKALKEQAEQFGEMLRNHYEVAEKALTEQAVEYEDRFSKVLQSDREALQEKHSADLAEKLSAQAKQFQQRLHDDLERQAEQLEKFWTAEVKLRVDEERGGRLARLDHLSLKVKQLEKISLEAGDRLDVSHKVHLLWTALQSVNSVLEQPYQASLTREINVLKQCGKEFPLVETVIDTLPNNVIREGVPSALELEHRFDSVRSAVRKAQYLPAEGGGPISYAVSALLSYVTFPKSGRVPGDDVESILARSEWFLKAGDVDSAAREMNQLRGWPRVLAKEWLVNARKHLEVKQALEVVKAHLSLQSLGVV
ncbi:mitochondrial inner membrane protein Mitofilin [Phlyctochytrium arcticum]|nr:mitochondrial inner membrane protein Mitofilin [Phlyctochytrium arcticum]